MNIYLDNSFLNRPFDNSEVGINRLESEVLLLIHKLVKTGKVNLVNSSVVEYENSLNPFSDRKLFIQELLKESTLFQNINQKIRVRGESITEHMNTAPVDALHLATAEEAKVDLFITCDYNLIKKYKGKLKIITPLEFLAIYEHTNQ